jgi:hypothetical protein
MTSQGMTAWRGGFGAFFFMVTLHSPRAINAAFRLKRAINLIHLPSRTLIKE